MRTKKTWFIVVVVKKGVRNVNTCIKRQGYVYWYVDTSKSMTRSKIKRLRRVQVSTHEVRVIKKLRKHPFTLKDDLYFICRNKPHLDQYEMT